jgi:cyclic-di-GMP phosphodiesterase TipF (flagellum assembly factor)
VLTVLAVYNTVSTRMGMRTVVGSQLTDLSRGSADLARQVAEIGHRLETLESKVENTLDKTRAVTDPLAVELGELGTLVKQIADTVAAHATSLTELKRAGGERSAGERSASERLAGGAAAAEPAATAPASEPTALIEGASAAPATTAAGSSSPDDMLAFIRSAIDASRIDLYLQPIVTLPQRKVRYYEAMSRLRSEKGEIVPAANFIAQADSAGLMPKIDNLVIFRCVQVVRRLLLKNREIGLFCNVAGSTLNDALVFQQLLEFMEANRAIAPSIVLEFTQAFLRTAGPIENESLHALQELGFRFSLDNVHDLRLEPRELAQRGFRFVKVPASLLLNRSGEAATDIHPADLSDLLGRFGIDLVAEKIESEGTVVDLLDYDVRYGQGFLFSPPRPVRAEALQGIAERSDLVARETGPETAAGGGGARAADDVTTTDATNGKRTGGLAQLARRV